MGGCGCVCHGESLGGCTRKMGAARTPSDNPERAVRVREGQAGPVVTCAACAL